MRPLNLTTKTGFRITRPEIPVIIRDSRGTMFYSTEPVLPNVKEFNLPAGKYFVDSGFFTELPTPVMYRLAKLPPRQRSRPFPTDFKLLWGNNDKKCTVDWDRKTITFDQSMAESPLSHLDFIKYHEFGHARYGCNPETSPPEKIIQCEKFADLFAVNCMLRKGYNPEQIAETNIDSLSHKQGERKEFITDVISKITKRL
jgi:hypothetical protein